MEERWKPVVGFETRYAVSENGRLISTATFAGKERTTPLRPYDNGNGYLAFRFQIGAERRKLFMHRVVWQAFMGDIPGGLDINHKNGCRDDNRLDNLETMTRSENMLHGVAVLGRNAENAARGSAHGCAKLTEEDIPVICYLLVRGATHRDIAPCFGVSETTISHIATGKTWQTITGHTT